MIVHFFASAQLCLKWIRLKGLETDVVEQFSTGVTFVCTYVHTCTHVRIVYFISTCSSYHSRMPGIETIELMSRDLLE